MDGTIVNSSSSMVILMGTRTCELYSQILVVDCRLSIMLLDNASLFILIVVLLLVSSVLKSPIQPVHCAT